MIEIYCHVNETVGKVKADERVERIAQYLLDEVCSNYDYEWANAMESDKELFRDYAKEILTIEQLNPSTGMLAVLPGSGATS